MRQQVDADTGRQGRCRPEFRHELTRHSDDCQFDSDRQHERYQVQRHDIDPVLVLWTADRLRFPHMGELVLINCTFPRHACLSPNQTTTNQPNGREEQQREDGIQGRGGLPTGIELDMINQFDLNGVVPNRDQFASRTQ